MSSMMPNSAEVEAIVRVVLERLRSSSALPERSSRFRGDQGTAGGVENGPAAPSPIAPSIAASPGELNIGQKLVTLESLVGRLEGVHVVRVLPRAVVTPAVIDELRQRKIRLEKSIATETSTTVAGDRRLLMMASREKLGMVSRMGEFAAASDNCTADVGRITAHMNSGGLAAIWSAKTPFAAIRAAAANPVLRAVQLAEVKDLERAYSEAEPNVLIVDDTKWKAECLVQLAQQWIGSLS